MDHQIQEVLKEAERERGESEIQHICNRITELLKTYPQNTSLLHARAQLYFKLDKLGSSINDYKTIHTIDDHDKFATSQIEHLSTILRFRNSDIFENPNTSHDPWLE